MDMEPQPQQPESQGHHAFLCSVKNTRPHSKILCEEAASVRIASQTLRQQAKRAWLSAPAFPNGIASRLR
jgi:hypothetical protein